MSAIILFTIYCEFVGMSHPTERGRVSVRLGVVI
jgi:hypothetical protein